MPEPQRLDAKTRFDRHVDRSPHPRGCWIWTGALNKWGYGIFGWEPGKKTMRAHRASYLLHKGDPGAAKVMHGCDTPACVNPEHLSLGTQRHNMRDRAIKGRWKGGRPRMLTAEQSANIARRAKMGESLNAIAKSLKIARGTVRNALGASRHG